MAWQPLYMHISQYIIPCLTNMLMKLISRSLFFSHIETSKIYKHFVRVNQIALVGKS